jgi:hypothetical protein
MRETILFKKGIFSMVTLHLFVPVEFSRLHTQFFVTTFLLRTVIIVFKVEYLDGEEFSRCFSRVPVRTKVRSVSKNLESNLGMSPMIKNSAHTNSSYPFQDVSTPETGRENGTPYYSREI